MNAGYANTLSSLALAIWSGGGVQSFPVETLKNSNENDPRRPNGR